MKELICEIFDSNQRLTWRPRSQTEVRSPFFPLSLPLTVIVQSGDASDPSSNLLFNRERLKDSFKSAKLLSVVENLSSRGVISAIRWTSVMADQLRSA